MSKAQVEKYKIASPRINQRKYRPNLRLLETFGNLNLETLSKIPTSSLEGLSSYNKICSSGSTSLDTQNTHTRNHPKGLNSLSTYPLNIKSHSNPKVQVKTNPSNLRSYHKHNSNTLISLTTNIPINNKARKPKLYYPEHLTTGPFEYDKTADIVSSIANIKIDSLKHSLSLLFNFKHSNNLSKRHPLSSSKDNNIPPAISPNKNNTFNRNGILRINSPKSERTDKTSTINKVKSISKKKKPKNHNQNPRERFLEYLNKELIEKRTKKEWSIQVEKITAEKAKMNKLKLLKKTLLPAYLRKRKIKVLGNNPSEYTNIKKNLLNELVTDYNNTVKQFFIEKTQLYIMTFHTVVNISIVNSYHNKLLNHYFFLYEAIVSQFQEVSTYRYQSRIDFIQQYKIVNKTRPKERTPIVDSADLIKDLYNDTNKFCLKNQLFINGLIYRESNEIINRKIQFKKVELIDSPIIQGSSRPKLPKSNDQFKRRPSSYRKNMYRLAAKINLHLNSDIKVLQERGLYKLTGHNCEFDTLFKNNHLFQLMDGSLSPSKKQLKIKLEKEIFRHHSKKIYYFRKPMIDKKTLDHFTQIIIQQNEEMFKYNFEYYISKHDLDSRDDKGNTLLSIAAQENQIGICLYLISKGADVNVPNIFMNIPLHYAVSHKNNDLINILIQNHSNEELINNKGHNPWQCTNETCDR